MADFEDITYDLLRFQNASEYHEIMSRFAQVKYQLNGIEDHSEKNCNEVAAAVMSASAKLFLEMLSMLKHCCVSNSMRDSGAAALRKLFTKRRI